MDRQNVKKEKERVYNTKRRERESSKSRHQPCVVVALLYTVFDQIYTKSVASLEMEKQEESYIHTNIDIDIDIDVV